MELYISTRMTHGVMNHHCLKRSHLELYDKSRSLQPLAQEFISAAGKGGMAHNGKCVCEGVVLELPKLHICFVVD